MTTYGRKSETTQEEDKYQDRARYSPHDQDAEEPISEGRAYTHKDPRRFTFDEAKKMLARKQSVDRAQE